MPLGSIVLRPVGFMDPCTHLPPEWMEGKDREDLPYVDGATAHVKALLPHARHVHFINLSSPCSPPARWSFVLLSWPALVERCQEPFPVNWILVVHPPPVCFVRGFNTTYWPIDTDPRFMRWAEFYPSSSYPASSLNLSCPLPPHTPKKPFFSDSLSLSATRTHKCSCFCVC